MKVTYKCGHFFELLSSKEQLGLVAQDILDEHSRINCPTCQSKIDSEIYRNTPGVVIGKSNPVVV